MISIDCLDIKGMKKADFVLLEEMFNHVMSENIRWDRKDWWDARNKRLKRWLVGVNTLLADVRIKEK